MDKKDIQEMNNITKQINDITKAINAAHATDEGGASITYDEDEDNKKIKSIDSKISKLITSLGCQNYTEDIVACVNAIRKLETLKLYYTQNDPIFLD